MIAPPGNMHLTALRAAADTWVLGGQDPREGLEALTQPVGELAAVGPAGRHVKHDALLRIEASADLRAIRHERRLHGGMADAMGQRSPDRV